MIYNHTKNLQTDLNQNTGESNEERPYKAEYCSDTRIMHKSPNIKQIV